MKKQKSDLINNLNIFASGMASFMCSHFVAPSRILVNVSGIRVWKYDDIMQSMTWKHVHKCLTIGDVLNSYKKFGNFDHILCVQSAYEIDKVFRLEYAKTIGN